ncbi:hypothetical protein STA3757_32630 [Stanieria sp. NIES-3757]|nr:hypothetical protein STA3757_32630 [Stanieria sp. NIES-3757]
MPFGLKKPNLAIEPDRGTQYFYFEETSEIGVIKNNVYPNFTLTQLIKSLSHTKIILYSWDFQETLIDICQTPSEKFFLNYYLTNYIRRNHNLPILIPQAWIQWHSKSKNELRSNNSSYADDLYRVDFVAFWNNKRYAILVDDISHYAENKYKNPAMSKIKRFINPETAISKRSASLRRTWCTRGAALEKDFDMSDTSSNNKSIKSRKDKLIPEK